MTRVPRIPRQPETPQSPDGDDASRPDEGASHPSPETDEPTAWRSRPPPLPPQAPRSSPPPAARTAEPALLLPQPVVAMLVLIVVIHTARTFLSDQQDILVQMWLAFIPARYDDAYYGFPGGVAADVWTFVTYAVLHGSWVHLITNAVWLVAFGSAVARRFGAARFWVFSIAAAAGGSALHLALHFGEPIPVVGASAAIAGQMAAASRFVFDANGPLVLRRQGDDAVYRRPARTLGDTFRNRTALIFIVAWFAINLAVGLGSSVSGGLAIAWEAHIGGFLVGLLLFRYFDPVPR